MSASVPLTLVNSLQLAKQGDMEAIAALVNRALQARGIRVVAASAEGDLLHLVLESDPAPDPEKVIPFIRQSLSYLGTEPIRRVMIYGKSLQPQAQWGQEILLEAPPPVMVEPPGASSEVQSQQQERSQDIGSTASNGTVTVAEVPITQLESLEVGSSPVAIGNIILHPTAHGSVVNLAPAYRRASVRSRSVPTPSHHPDDLLDRQLETEEAITTLQSSASVNFFGETGSGKTALLRSLAHHSQLAATFRDGVVYQRQRFHTAEDALQSLFDSFFEYDSDIPARPTLTEIRQAFQGRRALAVLDDLNLPPTEVAQIYSLPGLTLLSASHERHVAQGINAMPMLGLPLNDALALLERGLGRSLASEERAVAETICAQVQGHPQRILQLAALARDEQQALAVMAERLRIAPSLDAVTLKAAVSLPEAERRVLAALVVFDGVSIRAEHLAALTGLPNVQTVLANLTQRYLVLEDNSRYYLSQAIATALRQAWDLSQWVRRVLTYFYQWLERQTQLDPILPELDVLLQVTRLAVATQQHSLVLRLAEALDLGLIVTGRWGAWDQVWQWALQAGRSQRDPVATASALHQLGTRALIVNDLLTAHTQLVEALQLRHSLGNRPGSITTRHNLGLLLTLPMEVDPVAVTAAPLPALSSSRWKQTAIVVGSLGMAIAGMVLLLNPFPRPASFSLSATRLGFGGQTLNTTSQVQTVRITNTGTTPLEITSVTPSGNSQDDFQVSETCTTAPVAPQQDCTLEVTFTPQAEGDRLASVLILDRAGDNPQELILSGIGEPPTSPFVLSFAPGNVSFDPQAVGSQGKPQSIMVTNTGSEPVAIARVAISGNQSSDFQSTTNCVNTTLAPKQTCNVQITFAPKALNNRRASLVIIAKGDSDLLATGDLPDQPPPFWNIPLSGTGVAPTAAPPPTAPQTPVETSPRVSLSLSELNFAPQTLETGAEKPLVIANTGTASLYIDELSIEGENAGDFVVADNNCFGGPILAEDGCIVTVRFSPNGTGLRRAELVIRDSASGSPRRIALSGVGVQRSPTPAPTPSVAPPTILNFTASPSEITAGESVQLCYGVSNVTQVNLEGVGSVEPVAENCVTVQPSQTTTYNLSARAANGQEVTAQTTVQVGQPPVAPPDPPDLGPPTPPEPASPGSRDRSSAPDLLSCPNSVPLTWQAGTGGNTPSEYRLTLQYLSDDQQDWITALEGTRSSGIDVAPLLLQYQSYEWRWMVRSLDAQGRSSEPSPWLYFTCYDLR